MLWDGAPVAVSRWTPPDYGDDASSERIHIPWQAERSGPLLPALRNWLSARHTYVEWCGVSHAPLRVDTRVVNEPLRDARRPGPVG